MVSKQAQSVVQRQLNQSKALEFQLNIIEKKNKVYVKDTLASPKSTLKKGKYHV
jgi:hypothetical protein